MEEQMTGITTTVKNELNKMNRAAKDAVLGTRLYNMGTLTTGSYTSDSADANGSAIIIPTGQTGITGFQVQNFRSGSRLYAMNCSTTGSNLNIKSSASATWIINAGDVIEWIVF
jgi:hypothetical protein